MEQLVVILIFVTIAVANHFLKKMKEGADDGFGNDVPVQKPRPVYRPVAQSQESEEERLRKFMEALGVPPATPLPPRRVAPPGRAPQLAQAPRPAARPAQAEKSPPTVLRRKPVPATPPPIVQPVMIEVSETRAEPETSFPEAALFPSVLAREEAPAAAPAPSKTEPVISCLPQNIRAMLRNRDSIRSAILLREIIDAPRGLQSYR